MRSVGVLSFYPAFFPPNSGGELRLYNLYHRLAERKFHVDMVSPTYSHHEREVIQHSPRFRELRLPKTEAYNRLHGLNDRFSKFSECSGLVCSLACEKHEEFAREAQRLAKDSDILVQECMFLTPLIPAKRRKGQLLVYASQNVEARLAAAMFGGSVYGKLGTRRIRKLEGRMMREADIVFACSEEDGVGFQQEYGLERSKLHIVPNGVDVEAVRPVETPEQREEARNLLQLTSARPACFFIGSFHPPNVEAVDIIIASLAGSFPEVDFLIAGKVCNSYEGRPVPANVRMLGLVDEEQKMALFHGCDVALNTMVSGSGTNLKMLDYFSAGLPVLTTPVGARGLSVEHCRQANIQEAPYLAQGLKVMLESEPFRKTLGEEARKHAVDHFSWQAIGDRMADLFTVKTGRRIVIVNDFSVMPAEQGGQVRVEAVAKDLSNNGMSVTLLTLSGDGFRRHQVSPTLEEINIPRSKTHRRLDMRFNAWVGCGCDDVTALLFTRSLTPEFGRVLNREVKRAESVLLCHPYLESVTKDLPPSIKLYYDSLNTEFHLKQKLYPKTAFCRYLVSRTRRAELSAARRAKASFCVSGENRRDLAQLVRQFEGASHVAPNGVDCSLAFVRTREEKQAMREQIGLQAESIAVFLGSGHPPNAEAARVIRDQIAPLFPKVLFLLVGNVTGWFHGQELGPNVVPIGSVSTPVKNYLLQCSDFALNPMLTGSGTSLKLFDYLANGIPVISTPIGARGLDEDGLKALVIVEAKLFPDEVRRLLKEPERADALSIAGRKLAEDHFDWPVALSPIRRIIVGVG